MKSSSTAIFGKLVFGILLLFVVGSANAQSTSSEGAAKEGVATVKYLGTQDDMIVFNVSYANPEGTRFVLSVKDQDGTQLYQNAFTEKSFYKQFKLPKADRNKLIFLIRNNRDEEIAKTFEISVNSRFVEDIAIKKIN